MKLFGEIDTIANPVCFTPWCWKHMTNSMWGFGCIYFYFLLLKCLFNKYPLNKNKKKYILMFCLYQLQILETNSKGRSQLTLDGFITPSKYIKGHLFFSAVNSLFIYWFLNKHYLGPNKKYAQKKSFLDHLFCKEYHGKYNKIQPFTQDTIFTLTLWIWFYSHTVYEYNTAGEKGRDKWFSTVIPEGHQESPSTNSYLNSVGDTIAGFFGCTLVLSTIKNNGCCWGVPLSFFSFYLIGDKCLGVYEKQGWFIN